MRGWVTSQTNLSPIPCKFQADIRKGLYRGYKLRNAKLDRMTANPPNFLAKAKVPLHQQPFQDVTTQEKLKELHDHLFLKLQFLNMDYGHGKFLDSLQGQKASTIKALERLERRTADVLYQRQNWFSWVRECQDEEEKTRDKEQKKVKVEAAMAKEDKLRQDAFLEQVYKERMAEKEKNRRQDGSQRGRNQRPFARCLDRDDRMHDRLKNSEDFDNNRVVGMMIAGTIETPVIATKTVTFPEDQIATALRANSVEEFLADEEVTAGALRDLCLNMENLGLQEICDACADLFRDEDEANDDVEEPQQQQDDGKKSKKPFDMPVFKREKQMEDLLDKWVMGAMPTAEAILGVEGGAVDFGKTEPSTTRSRKIKVKICRRTIWNYLSNKAMYRGGWLHFRILAKESNPHDAIALCRHWDEFFKLNLLAICGYFPGENWVEWVGNRQQMLQLCKPDAMALTVRHQQGGRRGQFRRSHSVFEARNFMCAHIKRDDQASRRLVQYLAMQSHRLLVLVRDAETGRLLIKPPEEKRWLYRQKSGLERVAKNDWEIIKSVGPEFFEDMGNWRQWSFSFEEYYDVYVWDLEAGEYFPALYNAVQEILMKALRCRCPQDLYSLATPVLKTLCKYELTKRVRDIRLGEDVKSIYDEIYGPDNKFPRNLFYNRADELEDKILFPEERLAQGDDELDEDEEFDDGSELDEEDIPYNDGDEDIEDIEDDSHNQDEDTLIAIANGDSLKDPKSRPMTRDILSKNPNDKEMREEFMAFIDKEKARIFKEVWHKADLAPHAQTRYIEMVEMTRKCRRYNHFTFDCAPVIPALTLIDELNVGYEDKKDLHQAIAKLTPFSHKEFFASKYGDDFKDSLLFRQEERAKAARDTRSHYSVRMCPAEFFEKLDAEFATADGIEDLPEECDLVVRPTMAHHIKLTILDVYKSGVIRNRADTYHEAQAFAAKEPGRDTYDFYTESRSNMDSTTMPKEVTSPYDVPFFKIFARAFASLTPTPASRFSLYGALLICTPS
ncbi:uncharacterized protein PAC_16540 [Phialocephala subalpina]|uniref:Uncharacterized protein n=1 Tax=Phialocephala subalpina TaxID=576137 RepID=A0A1L7XNM8_9HELO|nr:uncharacterized protein PAC_16540 [Phialocephala subalpina]